jgi:hypothetical protein
MSDRFRTFALTPANTGVNTLFTVPVANVAATPPTPVTTFMVQNHCFTQSNRFRNIRRCTNIQ